MSTNKDILTAWTLDREKVLRDNYAKKNIKASGEFGKTLRHEVTDNSITIYGNKYIGGSIYGRKPNTDQSPEGLRRWALAFRLVMSAWAVRRNKPFDAGYGIAYHIAKYGYKTPNRFGNDGRLLTDTFTSESIDQLKRDIGRLYLTETSQITQKIFEAWR